MTSVKLTEVGANHFNNKYLINHQSMKAFVPDQKVQISDYRLWVDGGSMWIPALPEFFQAKQLTLSAPLVVSAEKKRALLKILYDDKTMAVKNSVRKNDGKLKAAYILKFPHAIAELAKVMTENEKKYPNDRFSEYVPEETVESLTRHLTDLVAPDQVFEPKESKLTAATAILFNALCLVESIVAQSHPWADKT